MASEWASVDLRWALSLRSGINSYPAFCEGLWDLRRNAISLKRRAECRVVDRVGFTSFHLDWVPLCLVCFVVFVLRCFALVYLKGTWFFCEFKCYHTRQSSAIKDFREQSQNNRPSHTVWIETFFLAGGCLGMSRAERPSVSWAMVSKTLWP